MLKTVVGNLSPNLNETSILILPTQLILSTVQDVPVYKKQTSQCVVYGPCINRKLFTMTYLQYRKRLNIRVYSRLGLHGDFYSYILLRVGT